MTICEECREQLTIERIVLENGDEIELSYCSKCKIMYVDGDYEVR